MNEYFHFFHNKKWNTWKKTVTYLIEMSRSETRCLQLESLRSLHSGPVSLGLLKLSRKVKIHPKSVFTKFCTSNYIPYLPIPCLFFMSGSHFICLFSPNSTVFIFFALISIHSAISYFSVIPSSYELRIPNTHLFPQSLYKPENGP